MTIPLYCGLLPANELHIIIVVRMQFYAIEIARFVATLIIPE